MKTKTRSNKKFLLTLTLFVCLVFLCSIVVLPNLLIVQASNYSYSDTSSIKFTNWNFKTYTTGSKGVPYTVKDGWTISGDSNVVVGIIDTSEENFKSNNKFGLKDNPKVDETIGTSDSDYYILSFNSKSDGKASAKSEDVSLKAGKFYEISLYAKTFDGTGSIGINIDGTNYKEFTNIQTINQGISQWSKYHYFIATSDLSESQVNLTLRYGGGANNTSSGSVFYDNVVVTEISNVDFYSQIADYSNIKLDLRRNTIQAFSNSDFESGNNYWTADAVVGSSNQTVGVYNLDEINEKISTAFEGNKGKKVADSFTANNASSLLLLNVDETTSKISSSEDNLFTVAQHGLYKVTILFKTGDLSKDGLTFTLTPKNEDVTKVEVTNQKSTSGLSNYNGFAQVTFYVKGSPLSDEDVSLSISLGEGKGWAIVDNISVIKIKNSEFSSTNALDFSSLVKDTSTITNGGFDFAENQDVDVSYPLKPKGWTLSSNIDNGESGIIRINPAYFGSDSQKYGSPENPGVNTAIYKDIAIDENNFNQNVLMIRTHSNQDAYYTFNDSISLTANSSSSQKIAKISVCLKTQNNAKAFIRVLDKNNNVVALLDNLSTNNDWVEYDVYIKNGISEYSLKLEIGAKGLGSDNFVFFDGISYTSESKDDVSDMTKQNCAYVDLMNNSFYSSTNFYSYLSPNNEFNYANVSNVLTREDASDNYVLKITNDIDTYQQVLSNYTYSLKQGTYYEFSVWIKTTFESNESHNFNDYGAYFEILNLDSDNKVIVDENNKNVFKNIKATNVSNEDNGWVKYSIYIYAESDQNVKVMFGVGSQDCLTFGTAYFDDLVVTDIDKDVYTAQKASDTTIVSTVVEAEETPEEESTPSTSPADINVWALVSSIILVVALILAIVGYYIRRIPKKKVRKVESGEYDKAKDEIDEAKVLEELKQQREINLVNLNKQLEEYKQQYEQLKNEYESKSNDQEDTVDKKLYTNYTKKANALIEKIEYINSAIVYLNDQTNVKISEQREIKRKKKELIEKNIKLNQQQNDVEEEKKEEKPKKKRIRRPTKFN